MIMKNKILYLILLLTLPISVLAENATNVRVRQRNKDIIVTYDLTKTSNVRLLMAAGSSSYTPLEAVEGAVGNRIHAGNGLEIIWHPLEEKENFIADDVRFKVEALGSYEQYLLPKSRKGEDLGGKTNMETFVTADFAYGFAPQLSGGLMLGQTYNGVGWFISARSNFNFQSSGKYGQAQKGGSIAGILPFYSGKRQSSHFVANAGAVVDFIEVGGGSKRNRFNTFGLYAGLGYGWRRMLWETVDGDWVEYLPNSATGVSTNIGIIGSVYGLTLKAGINTIKFKYLDVEVGIGWMF